MKASSIIMNIWEGKHSCVGRSVYTCRKREKVPNTNDFFYDSENINSVLNPTVNLQIKTEF